MEIEAIYNIYLQHPNICNDTRKITQGCIYWAIKGERFDGNTFAQEALDQGAAYAVVDDAIYATNEKCLLVEDSLKALQDLATYHRNQLKIPVVAITGSNGKTTTKELMLRVLSQKLKTFATPGNLNNHIGLPLSLLQLTKNHEAAIIELGANHQNENAFLCEICQPDCGIITNIGKDHLEGFGGMDGVEKANMELFDYLKKHNKTAFVNLDDERIKRNMNALEHFSYSAYMEADVFGEVTAKFPLLKAKISSKKTGKTFEVETQLFGSFQLYNLLAATLVGEYFGVETEQIKQALESYQPQNNRSQIIKQNSNTIILDAYNANPSSMSPAVKDFEAYPTEKKVLLLGDMFELGEDSAKEHKAILKQRKKGLNRKRLTLKTNTRNL
ncbi:MAG: UDP-N-acetylmuramoyl-tripeptide--D-alanyl-D-alanine ligase [Moraxellaceae bacterium]|nr:MAG: UDP-N-acetylmuramoyl-tripeptide--D-alanyl-D-alanine ligase [Moraxellaceae bacterium]